MEKATRLLSEFPDSLCPVSIRGRYTMDATIDESVKRTWLASDLFYGVGCDRAAELIGYEQQRRPRRTIGCRHKGNAFGCQIAGPF